MHSRQNEFVCRILVDFRNIPIEDSAIFFKQAAHIRNNLATVRIQLQLFNFFQDVFTFQYGLGLTELFPHDIGVGLCCGSQQLNQG